MRLRSHIIFLRSLPPGTILQREAIRTHLDIPNVDMGQNGSNLLILGILRHLSDDGSVRYVDNEGWELVDYDMKQWVNRKLAKLSR